MKKILLFVITCITFVAVQAYAETLSYSPEYARQIIEPGGRAEMDMTVSIPDLGTRTFYLWFLDSDIVLNGAPPLSWISARPSIDFLNIWWGSSSTTRLTIDVPPETAPGTYSNMLFSRAMSSHGFADPGSGMFLQVCVPFECRWDNSVEITYFGPEYLWPPDGSMEEVTVSGRIGIRPGCCPVRLWYTVDDEYGIYSGTGEIILPEDETFTFIIPVEASRYGQDKDGRHYVITIYVEDNQGITELSQLRATVPHDQRAKK